MDSTRSDDSSSPFGRQGLVASVRSESRRIMDMQTIKREEAKRSYLQQRKRREEKKRIVKEKSEMKWRRKMENSPFLVDLVADHERVDEENKMRLKEEARRERLLNKRKDKIKNEIILKALAEASDLEALREEKRAIALEEKRLKALIDLEKAKLKKKASHQAAVRAEKKRREAKLEHHRQEYSEYQKQRDELELQMLAEKHGVDPTPKDPMEFA